MSMIALDVYYIKHIGWVYQKKVSTFILAYDFFFKNIKKITSHTGSLQRHILVLYTLHYLSHVF
jgi:hypothetical protein